MFRFLTAALAAALVVLGSPALAWPFGIQGNGQKVVQQRSKLSDFKRIELKGSTDAVIQEGAFGVAVNIDSNLQQYVLTEVHGDTLLITTQESLQYHGVGRVEISMPALEGVLIRGSGDVTVDRMSGRNALELRTEGSGDIRYEGSPSTVDLSIRGSGDMRLQLSQPVEAVQVDIHGSGDVDLRGKSAGAMNVNISGSGGVNAKDLPAHHGRFQVSGSGDIKTTLTGGDAQFSASGSGDIEWWGEANVSRERSGGSGEVTHHG